MNSQDALEIGYQLRLLLLSNNQSTCNCDSKLISTTSTSISNKSLDIPDCSSARHFLNCQSHWLSNPKLLFSSLPQSTRIKANKLLSSLNLSSKVDECFFTWIRGIIAGGTVYEPGAISHPVSSSNALSTKSSHNVGTESAALRPTHWGRRIAAAAGGRRIVVHSGCGRFSAGDHQSSLRSLLYWICIVYVWYQI
jgi:hypothetical protein